jgi:hypothetical protein
VEPVKRLVRMVLAVTQAMAELAAQVLTAWLGLMVSFLVNPELMARQAAMAARVVPVD